MSVQTSVGIFVGPYVHWSVQMSIGTFLHLYVSIYLQYVAMHAYTPVCLV